MGDWKLVRPKKSGPFELYDLGEDIEEAHDVADEHPELLAKLMAFAEAAHRPPRNGEVIDPSIGFKGHKKS